MEALKPKSIYKKKKRVGRGPGSGMGKTSTRGHKGQKARKGSSIRIGFEGGQTPLIRRLPKRGFSNKRFQKKITEISLFMLDKFKDNTNVDLKEYQKAGLIDTEKAIIKILGNGELKKKLEVHAHKFSKSAKEKIEKLGGKAVIIEITNEGDKKPNSEIIEDKKEENKELKAEDKKDSEKK